MRFGSGDKLELELWKLQCYLKTMSSQFVLKDQNISHKLLVMLLVALILSCRANYLS